MYFVDDAARSSPPSPVPTSAPAARTACAPTATGRPSPTCATPPPPRYLKRGGVRRHHRPWLHRRGAGDSERPRRKGNYNIVQIDPDYVPRRSEHKDVFGITFEQGRQQLQNQRGAAGRTSSPKTRTCPKSAKRDMIVALITLKYTQSNSVCYVKDGQAIGVGAGQQSRIHCTRLAGNKADNWYLRQPSEGAGPPVRGRHPPSRPRQRHRRVPLRRVRRRACATARGSASFTERPEAADARGEEGLDRAA